MPTNWTAKVRAAIANLEINSDRGLDPAKAFSIIDDGVLGKFAAADPVTSAVGDGLRRTRHWRRAWAA
jgi:hypothetical protein